MHDPGTVLGIDIGGTKIAAARYDAKTFVLQEEMTVPTPAKEGITATLDAAHILVEKLRTADTTALGMGLPGLIEKKTGHLITAHNIADSNRFPVKEYMNKRCDLSVTVENDANCFALGEALYGAGKGHSVMFGIIMGTGVGGGLIINGSIYHGAHGFASEVGHTLLVPGHPPYPTDDKRGDTEQFLSGTSLGKRCEAAKRPQDYLVGEVCAYLRPEVFREVAWLCVNLTHVLDPSIIVFGGSTGRALKPHLAAIKSEMQQWLLPGASSPEIAIGTRKDAGTLGAAILCP